VQAHWPQQPNKKLPDPDTRLDPRITIYGLDRIEENSETDTTHDTDRFGVPVSDVVEDLEPKLCRSASCPEKYRTLSPKSQQPSHQNLISPLKNPQIPSEHA